MIFADLGGIPCIRSFKRKVLQTSDPFILNLCDYDLRVIPISTHPFLPSFLLP